MGSGTSCGAIHFLGFGTYKLVYKRTGESMAESTQAVPIGTLSGKPILSVATGNKLGHVADVRIDPVNGLLLGLMLEPRDGTSADLPYERIYSVGRDAVMASEDAIVQAAEDNETLSRPAKDLLGAKVVMESGQVLGEIADVLVTLNPPLAVIYEIRRSVLDRLLGRTFFIPASVGYALSDDAARLVVPDLTADIASPDVSSLTGPSVDVKSYPVPSSNDTWEDYGDETILREKDEDATVLRRRDDDDETLLIREDEDATVLRRPPRGD
jgi:uncharacterized protein YrrD